MGRPASLWLQKAYEILSDGQWHVREHVILEMMKTVPPAIAYRRGVATSRTPDHVPREQLIRRGARQLCHSSINGAGYVDNAHRDGHWLIRLSNSEVKKPPVPRLVDVVAEAEATHVLVPLQDYQHLAGVDVEFVRATS